jgi:predicted nucleotidyltransferase
MLEKKDKEALTDLKRIVEHLNIPMLMVGAGARILIFDRLFNIEGRTTKDWDFAVRLSSWESYRELSQMMSQEGFQVTSVPHRFTHIATGIELDLVPFSEIGQSDRQITWSDGNQMNLLGLDEAFTHAEVIQIDELSIAVVTLPAFVALKLIAWSDRGGVKDLQDLLLILRSYDDDRIYEVFSNELAEAILDFDEAPACLLGKDIQDIFSSLTVETLLQILDSILQQQDSLVSQLIQKEFDEDAWNRAFDRIVSLFQALR